MLYPSFLPDTRFEDYNNLPHIYWFLRQSSWNTVVTAQMNLFYVVWLTQPIQALFLFVFKGKLLVKATLKSPWWQITKQLTPTPHWPGRNGEHNQYECLKFECGWPDRQTLHVKDQWWHRRRNNHWLAN